MYRYSPADITEILLVSDHRITRVTPTKSSHTASLAERFSGFANIKLQETRHPRSLNRAIEELESLFFEDQAIAILSYPVLAACETSIDKLKISTAGLQRPAFLGEPPLKKTVVPDYSSFLGTDFKFTLYGDDVSNKISYDTDQLEMMVFENVMDKLNTLHKEQPRLFETSTPQKFFTLLGPQ